jgi:hypothetical protein
MRCIKLPIMIRTVAGVLVVAAASSHKGCSPLPAPRPCTKLDIAAIFPDLPIFIAYSYDNSKLTFFFKFYLSLNCAFTWKLNY